MKQIEDIVDNLPPNPSFEVTVVMFLPITWQLLIKRARYFMVTSLLYQFHEDWMNGFEVMASTYQSVSAA